MTKAEIIAAISSQITTQTAADSITPPIVGNLLVEITNQLPQIYNKIETNNYVILSTDYVLSVANGINDWGILLPSPVGITGKVYIIKSYSDADTGTMSITSVTGLVQGVNRIYYASLDVLNFRYSFMSNGTDWEMIQI